MIWDRVPRVPLSAPRIMSLNQRRASSRWAWPALEEPQRLELPLTEQMLIEKLDAAALVQALKPCLL